MRMRKKKHGEERLNACRAVLVEKPNTPIADTLRDFGKEAPLHLEIGCGKGGFACDLTAANQDFNLIAMERSSDVTCLALERCKASADSREDNLRFLIGDANLLDEYFPENTFDCIYLNFSDPWPKKGYYKRRLTYASFLEKYRRILKDGGILKQKTDNESLFDFSLEQFKEAGLEIVKMTRDLHNSPLAEGNIMTEYEKLFVSQGKPIYSAWVRFK